MKRSLFLFIALLCYASVMQAQNLYKTMIYAGTTRSYRIYIPPIYNTMQQPVPLVMALHGLGDNADNFQGVGFNQIANTENFITVYPNALPDPLLGAAGWSAGVNPLNNIDDVGFLSALIDTIQNNYSIDTSRIYICGFSMGGFMTHRLACELGGRIAAIASVAGTLPATMVANCYPGHPMPMMHIHGTSDQTIPYNYGVIYVVVTNLGADSTARFWASHNGCSFPANHDSMPDTKNDGLTFEKYSYTACGDSSEVILLKANGMSHTWPFSPTNDVDATDEMWNFFRRHRKISSADTMNTSVADISQDITFFPNPSTGEVNIQTGIFERSELRIYDLAGREVYRDYHHEPSFLVYLNDLQNGIYLLTVSNEAATVTEKLLVNR